LQATRLDDLPAPGFAALNQSGERPNAQCSAVPKSTQFTAAR
jgi:hypothetical protein